MAALKMVKGTGGALQLNKSYNFIDKDPVVDELAERVRLDGRTYREIAEDANVSIATVRNLFSGKTKRPQKLTVDKIGGIYGWRLGWVKA